MSSRLIGGGIGVVATLATVGGVAAIATDATAKNIGIAAAVIAGVVTVAAAVIAALKSTSVDSKADTITLLVDGRYGQVLEELAAVKQILANETGKATDQKAADVAQVRSDTQAEQVRIATVTEQEKEQA